MKGLFLTLIFLLYGIASETLAQRSNGLTIEGAVTVEQGSVDGAVIQMYRNGQRMGDYGIGTNGRYKVELNYNNDFVLIFSRKDNFPQKIEVDTHVPREVLQSDPLFPPFPVDIKLFTEIPQIDKTFSENTVQKIYYSKNVDNFISDLFYNEAQIKKLIDQAILQSQQLGKEADYLAGLTRAELAELRKEYDKFIKEAENEYNREEFLSALDGYKAANKIFPKEQYPKDRIAEINDLLGLLMVAEEMEKALADRLQELISRGDLMFEQKNYEEARSSYQRALSVDSGNNHAQSRLNEIKGIIDNQLTGKEYNALIVAADNSFDELLYAEARNIYTKALELKSGESYPQQRIREVDEILKQQASNAEKLEGYKESIFQAELNFEKQFYDKAISFYENALTHKPGDETAIRKIDEIKALMSRLANQTLYDKRIKTADKAFKKEQYDEALVEYEEAAKLIPSEQYPLSQIKQIKAVYAEQERLVAEAEAEKTRLAAEAEAEEQARLAALEAEKELQYNKAVSRADSLFMLKEYETSRTAYEAALQLKPGESLPEARISEIDDLLVKMASVQKQYEALVSRGDEAFNKDSFEGAKAAFSEAMQIMPEEVYPQEKLAQIDSIVEARERLVAEAEAEKLRLVAEAEAAELARLSAIEAEKERQYNQAVSRADSLFQLNEYESSKTAYETTLQLKPEEDIPEQRINEIVELLVKLAEAQSAYDAAVARGNEALSQESFEVDDNAIRQESLEIAKAAFKEAQQAKPEESYPQEMLGRIDSLEAAWQARLLALEAAEQARLSALEAEKEKKYNQAVHRADSLFVMKEYENSLVAYRTAQEVKPEENLPEQRINEINKLIGQMAAAQQAYDAAIAKGDDTFKNESYEEAKAAFLEAQKVKPEENYPKEMLAQIDSLVVVREQLAAEAEAERLRLAAEAEAAELARLAAIEAEKEQQFARAVSRADSLFNLNEYESSRSAYQMALQVNGDAAYPQQRIDEVNTILEDLERARLEQEKIETEFQNAVSIADQQFDSNDYLQAKAGYELAMGLKPNDAYPKDRIAEIDQLLQQLELDEKYQSIILAADGMFQEELWLEAKTEYENALNIIPDQSYPKVQLAKIDNLLKQLESKALADQQAAADMERRRAEIERRQQTLQDRQVMNDAGLNQMYQEYISLADGFFDTKNYNVSRAWYYKAWDLKQDELYPQQRIDEINRLVGSLLLSQRDRDYQQFVDLADSTFRENQLAVSRGWYNRALTIKPNESYPKEQLQAIADLIAERMAGRSGELFSSHIQKATEALEKQNYNVARYWYKKALELRPDDQEAKAKLAEIQDAVE